MALALNAHWFEGEQPAIWNRRLALLATVVLVVFLAWIMAQIIWQVIPEPGYHEPQWSAGAPANRPTNATTTNANLTPVAKLYLFGQPEVKTTTPEPRVTEAPETKLNLKLTGVYVAESEADSRAVISGGQGGNKESVYGIGEEISRSVALHEIHPTHVVLDRNGRYETLYLQKDTPRNQRNNRSQPVRSRNYSSSSRSPRTELSPEIGAELSQIREQLLADPTKAGELIRVQPVKNNNTGQFDGYRVYPGKDRALFRKVGLRSGDMITSINGQSLNDPAKGFQILSEITSATQITLEVNRRGQTQTLFVDLNQ